MPLAIDCWEVYDPRLEPTTDPATNNPPMPRKKSRFIKKDPRLIWKTLRVTKSPFQAEAIWKKIKAEWELVAASPSIDLIIATMKPQEAQNELSKRGWLCSWI